MATEHYGAADQFRAYCDDRGIIIPEGTPLDDRVSLVIASEWLDYTFRDAFPGVKLLGRAQEREWPRMLTVEFDAIIPKEVLYATFEAAAIQANSPGSLSVNYTPNKYKSLSVDGAVSIEFRNFDSAEETQTDYIRIRQILAPILTGGGNASRITGSSFRA